MFPDRVKALRKSVKLTQREFGERLGVSIDVVKNLEYNRVEPTDLIINVICAKFGVNEHWLRTGEGEMFEKPNEEDELMAMFGDLMKNDEPSFKKRMIRAICKLSDEQIEAAKKFLMELLDDQENKKDGEG